MPQSAYPHPTGTTDISPTRYDSNLDSTTDRRLTMIDELGAATETRTPFSLTLCLSVATSAAEAAIGASSGSHIRRLPAMREHPDVG